jgi:hypothetical protein
MYGGAAFFLYQTFFFPGLLPALSCWGQFTGILPIIQQTHDIPLLWLGAIIN